MNFAVIIPTRDRPQFFEHCREQMSRQTLKPTKVYAINYPSDNEDIDLVQRVKVGVDMAKSEGFDLVFIVEDDDALPSNYFERYSQHFKTADFIGDSQTTYYNILTLRWSSFSHPGRSSLFTTAFRISALNKFTWPPDNHKFLDMELWKYSVGRKRKFVDSGAVGIKHGQGLCGGKGHRMKLANADPAMNFLKGKLESYQIEFYEQLRRDLAAVAVR